MARARGILLGGNNTNTSASGGRRLQTTKKQAVADKNKEYSMENLPPGVKAADVDMLFRTSPSAEHSITATFHCKDGCSTLFTIDHGLEIVRFAD